MPRYLVTGGCGFIGSHLCDRLVADGHAVVVLDDLSTGKTENLPSGAEMIKGDVTDQLLVQRVMAEVDGCFHLAAIASVQRSLEDWVATHRVNQTGTVIVLDAARHGRAGQPVPVVYASTAAVYGQCADLPLAETSRPRPLSAYGVDKLACEMHAAIACTIHKVPTLGARFFNVFGPRQSPFSPYSGVISIFAERLLSGHPITIFGDGRQTRDFVYVGDVVNHLVKAMATADDKPRVINVCTGIPTPILDLAHTLAEILGCRPDIHFAPARHGDIRASLGNPDQCRKTLGLTAGTPLVVGLRHTLDHMLAELALIQPARI